LENAKSLEGSEKPFKEGVSCQWRTRAVELISLRIVNLCPDRGQKAIPLKVVSLNWLTEIQRIFEQMRRLELTSMDFPTVEANGSVMIAYWNWMKQRLRIAKILKMRILGPKLSSQPFNFFGVKAAETEIAGASEIYCRV
jgi:hypothetical protein